MSYVRNFHRLVVSGSLHDTESFSWGLSLVSSLQTTGAVVATVPQGIIDAVVAFHATEGVSSSAAKIETIKLNEIGTNGRYVNQGATVQYDLDPPAAGASSPHFPPQVALVVSLGTDVARGRAHAGRFYIPSPGASMETNGMIGPGWQGVVAAAAATMINAINATESVLRVGIVSNLGIGAEHPVTSVRVGRVLDTLRSRRTSLDEGYTVPIGVTDL